MKPVLVLLVSVCTLVVFVGSIPQPCPNAYYRDWYSVGSLCVKYYNDSRTFTDAEIFCRHTVPGGHLVSIHNEKTNKDILAIVKKHKKSSSSRIWLGAYELFKTNEFLWTDGSTWDFKNWVPGQPDNTRDAEDCVEMNWKKEGKWNDHHCSEKKRYMCAFKQSA